MLRAQGKLRALTPCLLLIGIGVEAVLVAGPARAERSRLTNRLVHTLSARDPALFERAARRLGLAGMAAVLSRPRKWRHAFAAVLEAAPLMERGWVLLPSIVELMAGPDRSLATLAAAAAVGVTEELRLPDLERTGDGPALAGDTCDRSGTVCGTLLEVASNQSVSLDVRVRSVMALANLVAVSLRSPERRLLALLSDGEPRVRETAVEIFAARASGVAIARLSRLVREDPEPRVARAAAAALCAHVGRQGRDGLARIAALKRARALPRLRRLAESLDATDDQLVELARCLARAASREDLRALARLRRRSRSLRRLLRHGAFR